MDISKTLFATMVKMPGWIGTGHRKNLLKSSVYLLLISEI